MSRHRAQFKELVPRRAVLFKSLTICRWELPRSSTSPVNGRRSGRSVSRWRATPRTAIALNTSLFLFLLLLSFLSLPTHLYLNNQPTHNITPREQRRPLKSAAPYCPTLQWVTERTLNDPCSIHTTPLRDRTSFSPSCPFHVFASSLDCFLLEIRRRTCGYTDEGKATRANSLDLYINFLVGIFTPLKIASDIFINREKTFLIAFGTHKTIKKYYNFKWKKFVPMTKVANKRI